MTFQFGLLIYNAMTIGFYDAQYKDRNIDCRGRLRSDKDGKYGYRAIVPTAYPVPGDVRPQ